ncbi:hypothetical protein BHE74_00024785 [Ensete ventricosum]|nr:hypothetical protein BHE74_00024785 [Ensete ventricosum]
MDYYANELNGIEYTTIRIETHTSEPNYLLALGSNSAFTIFVPLLPLVLELHISISWLPCFQFDPLLIAQRLRILCLICRFRS